jgi:hypothetical protein
MYFLDSGFHRNDEKKNYAKLSIELLDEGQNHRI